MPRKAAQPLDYSRYMTVNYWQSDPITQIATNHTCLNVYAPNQISFRRSPTEADPSAEFQIPLSTISPAMSENITISQIQHGQSSE